MTTHDEVRRSTIRHFIPGLVVFWLGALFVSRELPLWQGIVFAAAQTGAMILGYHLALMKTRKRTRRLSRIRGFAAGLVTPLVSGVTLAMVPVSVRFVFGLPSIVALGLAGSCAAGAFMAASMFVRRQPPELEKSQATGELTGESLEQWFERVEKEAEEHWYRAVRAPLIRVLRLLVSAGPPESPVPRLCRNCAGTHRSSAEKRGSDSIAMRRICPV